MRNRFLLAGMIAAALPVTAFAQTAAPAGGDAVPPTGTDTTPPIGTVTTSTPGTTTAPTDTATAIGSQPQDAANDIVVTAQKRAERLQDVPITIAVTNAAQLQAAGVTQTTDLTKVVPGLVFVQNESYAMPAIRGVTTNLGIVSSESPIAIYIDGAYLPSMNAAQFDLPDVDRIEVLKGPQGTLFGRNATGGAIQVFTKNPSFTPTGNFTVSDGVYDGAKTANEVSVNGFYSFPVSSNLAASVAGYYRYNSGYLQNDVNGASAGLQRSWGGRAKLLWKPTSNLRFLLSGFYFKQYDEAGYDRAPLDGITVAARYSDVVIPVGPYHVSYDPAKPNYVNRKVYGAILRGDYDLPSGTLSSITGYINSKNYNFVVPQAAYSVLCFNAKACQNTVYNIFSDSITQEFDFVSKRFGIFQVTAGLFYYRNWGEKQQIRITAGNPLVNVLSYDAPSPDTSYAGFAEVDLNPFRPVHIILGGRYSHEHITGDGTIVNNAPVYTPPRTDKAFTPRASIRYELDRNSNVYFTYSQGFKSGVIPHPTVVSRMGADPEKLYSFELGFKTVQGPFRFDASVFHYNYKDMQLSKYVGLTSFAQNAARSRINGADVDASLRATRDLTFTVAFNYTPTAKFLDYTDAPFFLRPANACGCNAPPITITNGDASGLRIIRTPKFTGTASVNWKHEYGFGALGFNASLYHSSTVLHDLAHVVKSPRSEDVSGQVYYEHDGMRFTIFAKNLFNNNDIATATSISSSVIPVLYRAPRQIGASAGYSF